MWRVMYKWCGLCNYTPEKTTCLLMSFFDLFRSKTPAEQLRENKRMIDRSIRELDRERMKMEGQEKKTVAEMKKLAKAGQKVFTL